MTALLVRRIGPAVALQDLGRPGYLANGLTASGAADRLALHEGAALLGQQAGGTVLEMVGTGGTFIVEGALRIALTGAEMSASVDGQALAWNASHALADGATLEIGATRAGTYGYLSVGGGFDGPQYMGSRAAHMSVGLGTLVKAADRLQILSSKGGPSGLTLPRDDRFAGGPVRIVPSMQTDAFPADIRDRFVATTFRRDPRANRQGVRMDFDGEGFSTPEMRSIVSEVIVPGDIQVTGDGSPFVLLAECQTTGGYPRIGTVIPADLPRVAQAPSGAPLTFTFITLDDAIAAERQHVERRDGLRRQARPLVRSPDDIHDLLGYQLISGAISALDPQET